MQHLTNSGVGNIGEMIDDSIPKCPTGDIVNIEDDSLGTFIKRFRRDMIYMERTGDSIPCLHEEMDKSLPPNQRGGPHMLACPCPKCNPRC